MYLAYIIYIDIRYDVINRALILVYAGKKNFRQHLYNSHFRHAREISRNLIYRIYDQHEIFKEEIENFTTNIITKRFRIEPMCERAL